jgi:hypothetical protein
MVRAGLSHRIAWIEIAGFDHTCCWEKIWPEIVAELAAALNSPLKKLDGRVAIG